MAYKRLFKYKDSLPLNYTLALAYHAANTNPIHAPYKDSLKEAESHVASDPDLARRQCMSNNYWMENDMISSIIILSLEFQSCIDGGQDVSHASVLAIKIATMLLEETPLEDSFSLFRGSLEHSVVTCITKVGLGAIKKDKPFVREITDKMFDDLSSNRPQPSRFIMERIAHSDKGLLLSTINKSEWSEIDLETALQLSKLSSNNKNLDENRSKLDRNCEAQAKYGPLLTQIYAQSPYVGRSRLIVDMDQWLKQFIVLSHDLGYETNEYLLYSSRVFSIATSGTRWPSAATLAISELDGFYDAVVQQPVRSSNFDSVMLAIAAEIRLQHGMRNNLKIVRLAAIALSEGKIDESCKQKYSQTEEFNMLCVIASIDKSLIVDNHKVVMDEILRLCFVIWSNQYSKSDAADRTIALILSSKDRLSKITLQSVQKKEKRKLFWHKAKRPIQIVSSVLLLSAFILLLFTKCAHDDSDGAVEASDNVTISSPSPSPKPITQAPSPSPTKTPTPEPTIVPTPTPTPEEPYCGIWVSATDYLDGGSNKVGNEWTITHYASFDGVKYVEVPYWGAWYSVDHPVTLYVKTVIVEDDKYPDEATNKYSIDIDTDKSLTATGSYWTINQWTDVVENNGAYRGNSCTWNTDWTITFLYN